MREITLFCEDSFHEKFIGAMLRRLNRDYKVGATLRPLSSRGGLSECTMSSRSFCAT